MLSNSAETSVDSGSGPNSLIKSPDIYMTDGNIAVVAGNVVFRVHRSQLALHSEVFRDMLSLVTEPKDGEVYDGCPVVRLTDESKDLAVLFKVMYGQIQFKPKMLDELLSAVRLSTKYLMDPIRTSALENLAIVYPDTLHKWDDNHCEPRNRCGEVLKLAVETNADILLPAACYAMSSENDLAIFDLDLPRPFIEKFLHGKDALTKRLAHFLNTKAASRPDESCFGDECSDLWGDIQEGQTCIVLQIYSNAYTAAINPSDPLSGLKHLLSVKEAALCRACKDIFKVGILDERALIWRDLPKTFGLGSWSTLSVKHNTV